MSEARSRIFRSYNKVVIKHAGFIEAAEAICPGSENQLHHPVWGLISGISDSPRDLLRYAQKLPPPMNQHILSYDSETEVTVIAPSIDIRKYMRKSSVFLKSLDRLRNLDAIATMLILIRTFDDNKVLKPAMAARVTLQNLLYEVARRPLFKRFIRDTFLLIDMDYIQSWREIYGENSCHIFDFLKPTDTYHANATIVKLLQLNAATDHSYSFILRDARKS